MNQDLRKEVRNRRSIRRAVIWNSATEFHSRPEGVRVPGPSRHLDCYTQIAYTEIAMAAAPMTVVETERFLKDAKLLMSETERAALVAFVGAHPEAGEIIQGTGGVRKIRWALTGRGSVAARERSTITTAGACRRSCWQPMRRMRRRT